MSVAEPGRDLNPAPAESLRRLKFIVEHLCDQWTHVLRRQTYMQAFGRSDDLREALKNTYAANVHNAIQEVLIVDLVRDLCALVLDKDRRSSSVYAALKALHDDSVMEELRLEYTVVPPLGPRLYNEEELTPEMRGAIADIWRDAELRRNMEEFERLCGQLSTIEADVLNAEIAPILWKARSKAVVHYDVVQEGNDWRLWRIEDTDGGLTYGQLDEYIDNCAKAIETLSGLVRRAWRDFGETKRIGQKYVNEYVDALLIGLRKQRSDHDQQRAQLLVRAEAMRGEPGP